MTLTSIRISDVLLPLRVSKWDLTCAALKRDTKMCAQQVLAPLKSYFPPSRTRPVSKAVSSDKGRQEPWHTFPNEAFEAR